MEESIRITPQLLKEAFLETLWPNRCALCDREGPLICPKCLYNLDYINPLTACPVCGSPFGKVQCCDCTTTLLDPLGLERPPFDGCVSATVLDGRSGRVVTVFKDAGDRYLADAMGTIIANAISPDWIADATVSFLPASKRAMVKRGWDHGQRLGEAVAQAISRPCVPLFQRPNAKDQRALSRVNRFTNMSQAIRLLPDTRVPAKVLLIDDVYTTGSTLFAASEVLKEAGAREVFCATFARAQ